MARQSVTGAGVLLAHFAVVGALACVGFLFPAIPGQTASLFTPACWVFAAVVLWSLCAWRLVRGPTVDAYVLFFVTAVLFNGGQVLLEVSHLTRGPFLSGQFPTALLAKAVYFVTVCVASLHLGALLGLGNNRARRDSMGYPDRAQARGARHVGWVLLIAAVIPWLILIRDYINVVMVSGYGGLFGRKAGAMPGAIQALATCAVPGALFLLVGSRGKPASLVIAGSVIGAQCLAGLFIGSRGMALTALLPAVWLYSRCIRPVSRATLLGIVTLIIFSIPIIRDIRGVEGRSRMSVYQYTGKAGQIGNPLTEAILELGGSMATVVYTLRLVPSVRPFEWGQSYLYALLTVVPNVAWRVHPTVEHGLLGDWLVRTVAPSLAARGGGFGFSFIAEAYLNFGWFGGPLALLCIGFLVVRLLALADDVGNVAGNAAVATVLSFLLLYGRAESAAVIRGVVWYAAVPYFVATLIPQEQTGRIRQVVSRYCGQCRNRPAQGRSPLTAYSAPHGPGPTDPRV